MAKEITDKDKYEALLASLSPEDIERRKVAIAEGYKDEQCPKCGQIFLAFHHFVMCHEVRCGTCPMVSNNKSLLDMMLEDCEKEEGKDKNESH